MAAEMHAQFSRESDIDVADVQLGKRVRLSRTLREVSQETLAKAIGVSFQQVHKYETAASRVPASRLLQIAYVLDVPVQFFFEGLEKRGDDHYLSFLTPEQVKLLLCFRELPSHQMEVLVRVLNCLGKKKVM